LLGVISGRGFKLSPVMIGVSKASIDGSEKPGSEKVAGAR
jgi:hypothetical protein